MFRTLISAFPSPLSISNIDFVCICQSCQGNLLCRVDRLRRVNTITRLHEALNPKSIERGHEHQGNRLGMQLMRHCLVRQKKPSCLFTRLLCYRWTGITGLVLETWCILILICGTLWKGWVGAEKEYR